MELDRPKRCDRRAAGFRAELGYGRRERLVVAFDNAAPETSGCVNYRLIRDASRVLFVGQQEAPKVRR